MPDKARVHPEPPGSAPRSPPKLGSDSPPRPSALNPGPETPQYAQQTQTGRGGTEPSSDAGVVRIAFAAGGAAEESLQLESPDFSAEKSSAQPQTAAPAPPSHPPAAAVAGAAAGAQGTAETKRPPGASSAKMSVIAKGLMGSLGPEAMAAHALRARRADQALEAFTKKTNQRNAFVSYSRRNKVFVEGLVRALRGLNLTLWVDYEDIPVGVDWRAMIKAGIQCSENVIFVLSPDWIASDECRKELEVALEQNKRLLPVLYEPPFPVVLPRAGLPRLAWTPPPLSSPHLLPHSSLYPLPTPRPSKHRPPLALPFPPPPPPPLQPPLFFLLFLCISNSTHSSSLYCNNIPEELAGINWIYARVSDDFDIAIGQIVAACQSDADYIKVLTRIATGCAQWMEEQESKTLLISNEREVELAASVIQQALTTDKKPKPTPDAIRYVEMSRQLVRQREKRIVTMIISLSILSILLLLAACGIVGWAVQLKLQADSSAAEATVQRNAAVAAKEVAEQQTLIAQNATAQANASRIAAEKSAAEATAARALAEASAEEARKAQTLAEASEKKAVTALAVNTAHSLSSAGQAYETAWADLGILYALQGVRQAFNLSSRDLVTERYAVNTLRRLLTRVGGVSLYRNMEELKAKCSNATVTASAMPQKLSVAEDGSDLIVLFSDGTVLRWQDLSSIAGARSFAVSADILACPPSTKTPTAALQLAVSRSRRYVVALTCVSGTCLDDGSATTSSFTTMRADVIDASSKTTIATRTFEGIGVGFAWINQDVLLMQQNGKFIAWASSGVEATLSDAAALSSNSAASRTTIWTCLAGTVFMTVSPNVTDEDSLKFTLYNISGMTPSGIANSPRSSYAMFQLRPNWSVKTKDISTASVQLRERDCGVLFVAVQTGAGGTLALHAVALNLTANSAATSVMRYTTIVTGSGGNPFTVSALANGPTRTSSRAPFLAMGGSSGSLVLLQTFADPNMDVVGYEDSARVSVPGITLDMTHVINLIHFPTNNFLFWADNSGSVYTTNAADLVDPGVNGLPARLLRHGKKLLALHTDASADFVASASTDGSIGLWRTRDAARQGPSARSRFQLVTGEPLKLLTVFTEELLGATSIHFFKGDAWLVASVNAEFSAFDTALAAARYASDGTNLLSSKAFGLEHSCTGKMGWTAPHPDASLGVFAAWCVAMTLDESSQVHVYRLPAAGDASRYGLNAGGTLAPAVSYPASTSANYVDSVFFTPDGRYLAIGASLYEIGATAGGLPGTGVAIDLAAAQAADASAAVAVMSSVIVSVHASADSRLIVLADSKGGMFAFRRDAAATGGAKLVLRMGGMESNYRVYSLVVGISGSFLAAPAPPMESSRDSTAVYLWRTSTLLSTSSVLGDKELSIPLSPSCPAVRAVTFSPDGKWLVTDDATTNRVCIFNASDPAQPQAWTLFSSLTVGYLSYGRQFVKFSASSSLLLAESTVLPGAQLLVLDGASSPLDEPWFFSGGTDVRGGALSSSGASVATFSARDRTLRVHDTSPAALATRACAMVKRSLSESEFSAVVQAQAGSSAHPYTDTCPGASWAAALPSTS
eukprot:tig00000350_g24350.t1